MEINLKARRCCDCDKGLHTLSGLYLPLQLFVLKRAIEEIS